MTPTPAPTTSDAAVLGFEFIVLALLFAVIGFVLMWMISRLGEKQPHIMIPLLVAVITISALIAFAITREEGLETITATGLGALAGALTFLFNPPPGAGEDEDEDEVEDEEWSPDP